MHSKDVKKAVNPQTKGKTEMEKTWTVIFGEKDSLKEIKI
jgi:hypothetical protein